MKQTNHFSLQAGVIGGNWGRVHVAGLRQAGCQVQALMARRCRAGGPHRRQEQIPHAGTELTILDGCELVAIATPTASHLGYLQALQDRAVLCEKPLGMTPDNEAAFAKLPADGSMSVTHSPSDGPRADGASPPRRIGPTATDQPGGRRQPALSQESGRMVCRGCGAPFSLLYTLFDEFEFQGVRARAGNNMTVQFRCQGAV